MLLSFSSSSASDIPPKVVLFPVAFLQAAVLVRLSAVPPMTDMPLENAELRRPLRLACLVPPSVHSVMPERSRGIVCGIFLCFLVRWLWHIFHP